MVYRNPDRFLLEIHGSGSGVSVSGRTRRVQDFRAHDAVGAYCIGRARRQSFRVRGSSDSNQLASNSSCRTRALNDSIKVLLSGRDKSSPALFQYAHWPSAFRANSSPLSHRKQATGDRPSWSKKFIRYIPVNPAQNYAKQILDAKYGKGNWKTGAGSEYSQRVKAIHRKKDNVGEPPKK
jgi:hypothetical protein